MSKFKIGNKVRVVGGFEGRSIYSHEPQLGDVFNVTEVQPWKNGSSTYRMKDSEGWWDESRFELVSEPTKRVKISFEGEVVPGTFGDFVGIGTQVLVLDRLPEGVVEYLPEPIVLPTKKHSLAIIKNVVYYGNGNGQFNFDYGRVIDAKAMQNIAEAYRHEYRVIFEGED